MAFKPATRERARHVFCVIAIVLLIAGAIKVFFPFGPTSNGEDGPTTNPSYLGMTWTESALRFCLAVLFVGAASAVFFVLEELKDAKLQERYWHHAFLELSSEKKVNPTAPNTSENKHTE